MDGWTDVLVVHFTKTMDACGEHCAIIMYCWYLYQGDNRWVAHGNMDGDSCSYCESGCHGELDAIIFILAIVFCINHAGNESGIYSMYIILNGIQWYSLNSISIYTHQIFKGSSGATGYNENKLTSARNLLPYVLSIVYVAKLIHSYVKTWCGTYFTCLFRANIRYKYLQTKPALFAAFQLLSSAFLCPWYIRGGCLRAHTHTRL